MTYITKDPSAVEFDYDLQSHSPCIAGFVKCVTKQAGLTRKKQKDMAKLIFLNFIVSQGRAVYATVNNNFTMNPQANPLGVGVTTLRTTLKRLTNTGVITKVVGKKLPYRNSISTTIRLREDLYNTLSRLSVLFEYPQLVVLRKFANGVKVPIDYLDTMRSDTIKYELQRYNSLLAKTKIELRDDIGVKIIKTLACPYLKRMFIDNDEVDSVGRPRFNSGGRLFGPWVGLRSSERPNIWLDDEPTVEEDYEASYVNVMYMAVTGARYVGDPYKMILDGSVVPRHIVKSLASMAVNNDTKDSAYKAFRADYMKLRGSTDSKKAGRYQDYQRYTFNTQLDPVLDEFLELHQPIAHLYLQGKELGNKVQCLESDLVFSIVDELTWAGIPCLTVHDSIIVQKKHQGLVRGLMDTTTFPDDEVVKWLD